MKVKVFFVRDKMKVMNKNVNWKMLSFFAALCFFLSAVENAIPKPVPFFRLGLANLPVMLSLVCMKRKETSLLIILKVLLQALVSGTLFSYIFIFSLAGSFASGFGMMGLYSLLKKNISWIGISLWGGLLNNGAQLFCAYFIMFGDSVRYIGPVLLCISFVTSILLGITVDLFVDKSCWLKAVTNMTEGEINLSGEKVEKKLEAKSLLFILLSLTGIVLVSFSQNLFVVYGLLVFFILVNILRKRKIHLVPSGLVVLAITFFSLLTPYGKILFSLGSWNITSGALSSGLLRGGKLCAMVFMSRSAVGKDLKLPGKAGLFTETVFRTVSELTEKKVVYKKERKLSEIFSELDNKLLETWNKERGEN